MIGCDGVHSVVANWLGLAAPLDSGRSAFRGLAVYPQGHGFTKDIHQFVDTGIRAGIVPLTDKEIYWFFVYQSFPHGNGLELGGRISIPANLFFILVYCHFRRCDV